MIDFLFLHLKSSQVSHRRYDYAVVYLFSGQFKSMSVTFIHNDIIFKVENFVKYSEWSHIK